MDVSEGGRFCPGCGAGLHEGLAPGGDARHAAASLVQEFWVGADRHFLCWCAGCGMLCTVVLSARLVSHEPEH